MKIFSNGCDFAVYTSRYTDEVIQRARKFYYAREILCLKTNPALETKLNYINAFDKVPRSDKLTATLIRL
jgi:hypothetical protein